MKNKKAPRKINHKSSVVTLGQGLQVLSAMLNSLRPGNNKKKSRLYSPSLRIQWCKISICSNTLSTSALTIFRKRRWS